MEYKVNYHYTDMCDMNCVFCFSNHTKGHNRDQVIKTFKKLCTLTKDINLVGGEVFLDKDLLLELIQIAIKFEVKVSIVTNGTFLLKDKLDETISHILTYIYQLGISIDSFIGETNRALGRIDNRNQTITLENLQKISSICESNNVKLKINTVVTSINLNESLIDFINIIKPDIWKVFQVVTGDISLGITEDEFNNFVNRNKYTLGKMKPESSKLMTNSYLMCNSEGDIYYDSSKSKVSIFENFVNLSEILDNIGFQRSYYQLRYN